jgi:putative acetyltransferase
VTTLVTIRPMTEADLSAVLDMWIASWQAAYPNIDFAARRGWAEDRFAELEQTGSQSFVAEAEGQIVGLVTVNPATGYLDQLAVAAAMQGQGIAERLLTQARALTPLLELHVNRDNARAIAFYRKHGFTVTGESTNPRSGAPIYLMRWRGR